MSLSRRDARFVALAHVAWGDDEAVLRAHVADALDSGDITISELREAVLQFALYAGWPKGSRFNSVVEEHGGEQAVRTSRPALSPEESFMTLNCVPFVPPRGNPYTDAVVDVIYGQVWQRPDLGVKQRRLVTLACALLAGVQTPIVSHVYAALKSRDLSFEEMDEVGGQFAGHQDVIAEQQRRVLAEWGREPGGHG